METKSLATIQKLANLGKILSKIVMIFSIIGVVGCILGIVCMALLDFDTIKIGDLTIHGLIEEKAGTSTGTIYTSMAVGMILCMGEVVLCKYAKRYFINELDAGTPFTFEGARELKKLGILNIWLPIATIIVADITYNIMNECMKDVADMNIDDYSSIGIGIAFLVLSLICKYGAELQEKE